MTNTLNRHHSATYSAWTEQGAQAGWSADAVLDALSDNILSDGVDSSLTKALHQGMTAKDGSSTPGLDSLRDKLRSKERAAISDLADLIDDEALSDTTAGGTDGTISLMFLALRSRSTSLVGAFSDATDCAKAEFGSLLEACAPAEDTFAIRDLLERLIELGRLERQLRSIRTVQDLGALDMDLLQSLLGSDASLDALRLAGSLKAFIESGYIQGRAARAVLSSRAVQKIGDILLQAALGRLQTRASGQHLRRERGYSHEPSGVSRDYEFGDPFDLDLGQTVMGAVKRQTGTPVALHVSDLKVHDREASERATTILAVDLSRSMGERGYLLAAKKLALALTTFIRTRYPHDELLLVGFSESARPMKLQELVDLQWDRYGFGTNVQDAMRLATGILNAHRGRRRNLVLITDGEPTAHRDAQGEVIFSHPPSEETIARTFREATRLRKDGVYLCVCVMSGDKQVTEFGSELAQRAAGDAIVTDPENLSADLVVTYSRARR